MNRLSIFILMFYCLSALGAMDEKKIREQFDDKQGIAVLKNNKNENVIYIKSSVNINNKKINNKINEDLELKIKKILYWSYSKKEKYKNKRFKLNIEKLIHDDYWSEGSTANLISHIKEDLVKVIFEKKTENKKTKVSMMKNAMINYLIPNSVSILNINNDKLLISLTTRDKKSHDAMEKINAYKIATRYAQKNLVEFIHGEKSSIKESLKSITIIDTQALVRQDITEFNEELRSIASGSLAKNRIQCWDNKNTYYCMAYLLLND